jgi:hypothetical protein
MKFYFQSVTAESRIDGLHCLTVGLIIILLAAVNNAHAGVPAKSQIVHTTAQVAIAAKLSAVQHGTYEGQDYLTLNIGARNVGPIGCQSNVLRLEAHSNANRQNQIEAIAISAMLSAETIMIVVPMDVTQCVEGKPTFTDLYPLPSGL